MIDWLYQTGLDISILIGIVLLIRNPVRKFLGANIAYWLWIIPLVRFPVWSRTEVPLAILEKINFTDGKILIKVFQNPDKFHLPNYFSYEVFWIMGMVVWAVIRIIGLVKFRKNLKIHSERISLKDLSFLTVMNKTTKVDFFYTKLPSAPFVTGIIKPQIYLFKESFDKLNTIQQNCIIQHELTHLKRKDLWMQVLAEIVRMIFWFNPIVHIAWQAFRQDQELACDYQVLAKSNNLERYEYGRVLLKGLHAHALPATMAFFNNHKQRFIMLEKHNNSKINNILGITLCTVLLVFALTKAPQSIAIENSHDMEVSFKFDSIPLKSVLELIFEANPKDVTGYENIPEINISFEAWNVSAIQIEKLILKCSGLKLLHQGKAHVIVKDKTFKEDYSQLNQCIQIQSKPDDASKETMDAILMRNKELREHLEQEGEEVPEYGTLPFEEPET